MANHKSALKRAKQSEIRRLRNKSYKTRVKKIIKEVRMAAESNSEEKARENLLKAVSIIHKTASKGVISRKEAARKISRLTRRVNQIAA